MTQALLKKHRTPLWVVLGAPLVGVPIMVGLLALGARKVERPVVDAVPVFVTEPVDTYVVEPVLNDSAARPEQELNAG